MANRNRIAVRDENGAITSIKDRIGRKVTDADQIGAGFINVLRRYGYKYSDTCFIGERRYHLLGWDHRTSTGVLALDSKGSGAADQEPTSGLTFVLARREGMDAFVIPVDAKPVTEAIRQWPHVPTAAVRAAERWLWPIPRREFDRAERRCEVLITREPGVSLGANILTETMRRIGTRHRLTAQEIAECDGLIYGLYPTLRAVNGDYPAFCGEYAWYSFRRPREATAPTDTNSVD